MIQFSRVLIMDLFKIFWLFSLQLLIKKVHKAHAINCRGTLSLIAWKFSHAWHAAATDGEKQLNPRWKQRNALRRLVLLARINCGD